MKRTKILSFVMASIISISNLAVPVFASDETKTVTILGTTDLHGRIYPWEYATDSEQEVGLAKIATLVKQEREKDPNLLLVDAGDSIESNMINLFNDDEVHPMIKGMNILNYDIWAIGNHEFNFGLDILNRAIANFDGEALSSNIIKTEDGSNFLPAYTIKQYDDVKIAFVGLIVPHIKRWEASTPEHYEGLDFIDPLVSIQSTMDTINENEDADLVIAVFHMGLEGAGYDPDLTDSASVIFEEVEGFDAAFVAHSHSTIGASDEQLFINDTIVVQPSSNGKFLAKLEIDVEKTADGYEVLDKRTDLLSVTGVEADEEMIDAFKYVDDRSKEAAYEVIGYTDAAFLPEEEFKGIPIAQTEDTAVIDLINEVQMFYGKADVSGAALFDTRSNLEKGDIQFKDAALIYKYSNTLQSHKITGAQLKEYMEWSASFYNTVKEGDVTVSFNENIRGYNYDMFAGVNYKVDVSKEAGNRIVDLTLNGKEVTDDMELVLAVNNYRVGTLQGLGILPEDGSSIVFDSVDTPTPEMQRLIGKYITEEKGGVISPEVDYNWELLNAPRDSYEKEVVQYLVNNDYITIPRSEDGRTSNVKAINLLETVPAIEDIELLNSEKLTDDEREVLMSFVKNRKSKNMGDLYELAYNTITEEKVEVLIQEEVTEETIEVLVQEEVTEKIQNVNTTYTVVTGDTLSGIAYKYNTNWMELQRVNNLLNADLIYPGQIITIQ